MWRENSDPFGDFQLLAPDACETLSVAYAPGQGWLVACTSRQGTRAQRLREDCTLAWGREGASLGSPTASPPALVFDSTSSFVLLERANAVGGERLLAYRYDLDGQPLWASPVDLGADLGPGGRPIDARAANGGVRVERGAGVAGHAGARATDLRSTGEVRFL
jgi:hypothetical protein